MSFDYSKVTTENAIKIGSDDAPLKIYEYINLRCPDSRFYEVRVTPFLEDYVKEGKVQRILKHFDKKVYALEAGNILNQYLDYNTPEETYEVIHELISKQDEWGEKNLSAIPHLAKEYNLSLQDDNLQRAEDVEKELTEVGIEKIPSILINGKSFVEFIDRDLFKQWVRENVE